MRNKKGFTLVEMLVSFALIAGFMLSALVIVNTSIRVFARAQNTAHAQTLSDTILDTIHAEYQMAVPAPEGTFAENVPVLITEEELTFMTQDGQTEQICAVDGRLRITKAEEILSDYFGENVYQKIKIKKLSFTPLQGENGQNLVQVILVLSDEKERAEFSYKEIISGHKMK